MLHLSLVISICLAGHGEVRALRLPPKTGLGLPPCAGCVGRLEVQQEQPSPLTLDPVQHRRSPKKMPGQHLAERRRPFSLVASGKSMPLSLLRRAQLHVGRRMRNISETEPRQLSPTTAQQPVR